MYHFPTRQGSVIVYYAIEFDPSVAYDVPTIDSDLEEKIRNNNNYFSIYLIDPKSVKHQGEGGVYFVFNYVPFSNSSFIQNGLLHF